jgi:hypothetical protein
VHNVFLVPIVIEVMTWSPRQHTYSSLADDVRIYSSDSQPDAITVSQPRGSSSLLLKVLKAKC